jgi:hypothetical protein
MVLNTWWDADPRQRYWMEITRRNDVGGDLQAPKLPDGQWSYDLVSQVRPGDRVLHWHSGSGHGLVGWSEVVGPAFMVPEYTWQPRGTSGRALKGPRTTPGWVAPLGGFASFQEPITLVSLLPLLEELMAANAELEANVGSPTYFPFYRYAGNQIRTNQAYFVKFPVELFDAIPGIKAALIQEGASESITEVNRSIPRRDQAAVARALEALEQIDESRTTKRRAEQSLLREYVLNGEIGDCALCGRTFPIQFLVVAHIKKRSECTEEEKRDFDNVVMPNCKFGCDELFERGYVGVNATGQIIVSDHAPKSGPVHAYIDQWLQERQCVFWNTHPGTHDYFAHGIQSLQ